jgi:hypothetical protein
MTDEELNLNPRPVIDWDALSDPTDEDDFSHAAFDLFKDAAQFITLAAGLRISEGSPLPRNQAIIAGHYIRMTKLMRTIMRQVHDGHGGDQQLSIFRQFIDSASTITYLLEDDGGGSRYDSYVVDSLIAEREFLKTIRAQVEARGGTKLPIEERIEHSIDATFAAAGVTEDQIPSRKKNNWPSNEARVNLLGPAAYDAYRTSSGAIHGSFADLEKHHLEEVDGGFEVWPAPARFRPQPLITMSLLGIRTIPHYFRTYVPQHPTLLGTQLAELYDQIKRLDAVHEQWLIDRRDQTRA